jgi:uncharacterized protein (TIGR03435 family)
MPFLASLALAAAFGNAQTPPAFAVISVKPSRTTDAGNAEMRVLPGGKVLIRNVPLLMIVAAAWDVPFQSPRLTGGREWQRIREDRFDIDAAAEPGAVPAGLTAKERGNLIRPMMQALLADRFGLTMRRDPKEQPVYALTIAKGGPKLDKSKTQEADCDAAPPDAPRICHQIGGGQGRGINGDAVSMDDVVLFVQNWTDRPVIDQTGLTDLYSIHTEGWAPMRLRPPNSDGVTPKGDSGVNDSDRQTLPDVFRQLGLALEPQKAVVDMFVIEHITRPAAN